MERHAVRNHLVTIRPYASVAKSVLLSDFICCYVHFQQFYESGYVI